MVQDSSDDRSPMAVGNRVVDTFDDDRPGNGPSGRWRLLARSSLGTSPVLIIVGAVLGFAVGMFHLLQIARQQGRTSRRNATRKKTKFTALAVLRLPSADCRRRSLLFRIVFLGAVVIVAAAVVLPLGWTISGNRAGFFAGAVAGGVCLLAA